MAERLYRTLYLLFVMAMVVWFMTFLQRAHAQDTNPKDIQAWYHNLTNRMGGSCCGEGDGYPAAVTRMPHATDDKGRENYHEDGEVCITDPSAKEIVVDGKVIKVRPALTAANLCHTFSWMKMAKEIHGNPFDHAIAFISPTIDGGIGGVYCVVILPMIY